MSYLQQLPDMPPISDRLTLLRLRALLAACETGPMPHAPGSTLHGAIGRAIKHTACAFPDAAHRPCAGCAVLARCTYPPLFEPQPIPGQSSPPPALLLAPGAAMPARLQPGSIVPIDLVLVGKAIQALPLLLAVLARMASAGLGPLRVPCTIVRVDAVDAAGTPYAAVQVGAEVAGREPDPLTTRAWLYRASTLPGVGTVTCDIRTRLRLQRQGFVSSDAPTFADVAKALVRRAAALAAAHCAEDAPFPDPRPWLAAAESIELREAHLRWEQHERRSARTGHTMPLDGFLGRLTYGGPPESLALFVLILLLGETIGLGRGCSFGNGRYSLDLPTANAP